MRYLIVGPSWVGDMVMAQCLLKAICAKDPQALIDVLAPAATFPLLERMPEVRKGILSPIAHGKLDLRSHRQLGQTLRGEYDQAFVLPGSLKSALIPWFAKVPIRTGWKGELRYFLLNDIRVLNKQAYPLMVDQFVALSLEKGASYSHQIGHGDPSLQVDENNRGQVMANLALKVSENNSEKHRILALCPGAEFGPAKKWPADKYAELAKQKIDSGWQVWIFGGPKDLETAEEIFSRLDDNQKSHCFILAGKTKLIDAIDLMSLADQVVSNDSGLMHIAAALGLKLSVIYGSTSPKFTPPLDTRAKIVSKQLECSPCFKRECPLGHLDCLNTLDADRVIDSFSS